METIGTKCNCYPFEEETMMNVPRRWMKNQHCGGFSGCYEESPKYSSWMKEQYESSSSSSSSSSESEDEMINLPTTKRMTKTSSTRRTPLLKDTTTEFPEWFTKVDLEGCYPHEIVAKVNTKSRVLLIKVISCTQTSRNFRSNKEMFLQNGKVVRIVPLPENIHIQKLCVILFSTGEVIVKAPFLQSTESFYRQKQMLRSLPLWVPIPVICKDTTFNKKHFSSLQRYPTYFPMSRMQTLGEQEEFCGQDWTGNMIGEKTLPYGSYFPTKSIYGNIFRPEIIRDEITGKLVMLIKVNTVGFLPEEVRVRVDETENTLIVEGMNKHCNIFTSGQMECTKEELLQKGFPVKYLRREFVLPHGCIDVNHIGYHMKESTGILLIKVPLLNTTESIFTTGTEHNMRGVENVDDVLRQIYHKWEKPLLA